MSVCNQYFSRSIKHTLYSTIVNRCLSGINTGPTNISFPIVFCAFIFTELAHLKNHAISWGKSKKYFKLLKYLIRKDIFKKDKASSGEFQTLDRLPYQSSGESRLHLEKCRIDIFIHLAWALGLCEMQRALFSCFNSDHNVKLLGFSNSF